MKSRSKFNDIQRFKEIAEILGIEFEQAEELFWKMNEMSLDRRHDAAADEEMLEIESEMGIA